MIRTLIHCAAAALMLVGASQTWAQISLPHTFTPDTPAKAEEVNENFQALATALGAVTTGQTLDGYGVPFSADGSLTGRNVAILAVPDSFAPGNTFYRVRIRYANTVGDTVSVNGSPTAFAFVALEAGVSVDAVGTVTFVRLTLEGMNTPDFSATNIEQGELDPVTFAKTINDDDISTTTHCFNSRVEHQVQHCYSPEMTADGSQFRRGRGGFISRIHSRLPQPITINGVTFDDVRVETRLDSGGVRLRARNHGWILDLGSDASTFFWSRINGVVRGSLAGTPFDTGGALDGLFFTP